MHALARSLLPAALAALVIVGYEALRTAFIGDTQLSGQGLGFVTALLGVLGAPLWILGCAGVTGLGAVRSAWGWARAGEPVQPPARTVAWALCVAFALLVLVFGVQAATERFVRAFRQPVYQGLGAGLVAAAMVTLFACVSVPVVRLVERMVGSVASRLPSLLDPTARRGAVVWVVLIVFGGSVIAPLVVTALHSLDLRPVRLLLGWTFVLAACVWWYDRRPRRWPSLVTALGLGGLLCVSLGWAAQSMGDSQRRLVAIDRDTLLAGPIARRLSAIGDGDGDGVSRLFAGGDCDDDDPNIRPGVYDPPGDGVDQNCTGTDLGKGARAFVRITRAAPAKAQAKHVVLITVDALRDDVVARHMPNLARLAAENVHFTNAYSHGAATYWSIPSLLASKMPSALHMGRDQTPVSREVLLTEVLRNGGWHTSLFANVTVFFVRGLRQGTYTANFDTSKYTVHGAKPGSAHLTDSLLRHADRWLEGRLQPAREKLHIWAHYYDPHDPYFEVPGHPAADGSDRARYLAIVRYVDAELARLIEGLKKRGLWDDTLFVLTSDHGDEFLDHGHRFHGSTLYEEMVHVPLIMHVPGVSRRRIEGPVGHMEVAPTMLELLGVRVPTQHMGRSRAVEILTGEAAADQPVFFEVFPDSNYHGHQVGVRSGPYKLIYRIAENIFELYDLSVDPLERDNVVDTHPEGPGLRALLSGYVDHHLFALGQGKSGAKLPPGAPKKPKSKSRPKRKRSKTAKRPKTAKKPKTATSPTPAAPTAPTGAIEPGAKANAKTAREQGGGAKPASPLRIPATKVRERRAIVEPTAKMPAPKDKRRP